MKNIRHGVANDLHVHLYSWQWRTHINQHLAGWGSQMRQDEGQLLPGRAPERGEVANENATEICMLGCSTLLLKDLLPDDCSLNAVQN